MPAWQQGTEKHGRASEQQSSKTAKKQGQKSRQQHNRAAGHQSKQGSKAARQAKL